MTQTGGLAQVVVDFRPMVPETKPPVILAKAPLRVMPDGIPLQAPETPPGGVLRGLGRAALLGFLVGDQKARDEVMAKLGLDPANADDVVAAEQYRWALNGGAKALGARNQAEVEATSLQVMRAVQTDPSLLKPIEDNDIPVIKSALDHGLTYNPDDPAASDLVGKMRAQGASNEAIARELAARGLDKAKGDTKTQKGTPDVARERQLPPPLVDMPPEQLRFNQRTAGFNDRYQAAREYTEANGTIQEPPDAVRTPDGIVTIDNTRVALARKYGLKSIPVRIWEPNDKIPPEFKAKRFARFDTWGDGLRDRVEGQNRLFPPQGRPKSRDCQKGKSGYE